MWGQVSSWSTFISLPRCVVFFVWMLCNRVGLLALDSKPSQQDGLPEDCAGQQRSSMQQFRDDTSVLIQKSGMPAMGDGAGRQCSHMDDTSLLMGRIKVERVEEHNFTEQAPIQMLRATLNETKLKVSSAIAKVATAPGLQLPEADGNGFQMFFGTNVSTANRVTSTSLSLFAKSLSKKAMSADRELIIFALVLICILPVCALMLLQVSRVRDVRSDRRMSDERSGRTGIASAVMKSPAEVRTEQVRMQQEQSRMQQETARVETQQNRSPEPGLGTAARYSPALGRLGQRLEAMRTPTGNLGAGPSSTSPLPDGATSSPEMLPSRAQRQVQSWRQTGATSSSEMLPSRLGSAVFAPPNSLAQMVVEPGAESIVDKDMPPPLCPTLVLTVCHARFGIPLPALSQITTDGEIDILGLSRNVLLQAVVRTVSGRKSLEIRMPDAGAEPRATIAPSIQGLAGGSIADGALVISGTNGVYYGKLVSAQGIYHVIRDGQSLLTMQGHPTRSSSGELTVMAGSGKNVASIKRSSEAFGGVDHVEVRVEAGVDVVLVILCVLAIFLWPEVK